MLRPFLPRVLPVLLKNMVSRRGAGWGRMCAWNTALLNRIMDHGCKKCEPQLLVPARFCFACNAYDGFDEEMLDAY